MRRCTVRVAAPLVVSPGCAAAHLAASTDRLHTTLGCLSTGRLKFASANWRIQPVLRFSSAHARLGWTSLGHRRLHTPLAIVVDCIAVYPRASVLPSELPSGGATPLSVALRLATEPTYTLAGQGGGMAPSSPSRLHQRQLGSLTAESTLHCVEVSLRVAGRTAWGAQARQGLGAAGRCIGGSTAAA